MTGADLSRIAELASEARTALDDPAGLPPEEDDAETWAEIDEQIEVYDRVYADAAPNRYALYAIAKLDEIIAMTRTDGEEQ